ncbi:ATP-binding protein [Marinovum sp.]|uniref:ATP-binding protein n=1 Tax=Marinovum sp. TaxID=2024839 RepID=UPI003A91EF19
MTRTADLRISLKARSSGFAVRSLLAEAMEVLATWGQPPETRGAIELALAEVLNNVVEHGYAFRDGGPFWLELALTPSELICTVIDQGLPYPGKTLPEGRESLLDGPVDDLPEGGFGWHLIRQMTSRLQYERRGGCNRLTLHFEVV